MVLLLGSAICGASGQDMEFLDRAKLPKVKPPEKTAHAQKPLHVKVLVLEFNPVIAPAVHAPTDPDAKPQSIRALGKWNDPVKLAAGYMQDLCDASGGYVQYEIVEWLCVREFQKKVDGFIYTPRQYVDCLRGEAKWHQPDGVDYPAAIARYKIVPRIESGEIDEVWWFGAPYFGYWESSMAGKGAFYINGGVYGEDQVPCRRPFVIMGFNYERGVAEMLHDLCHRTEATMERVYGGWDVKKLTTNWARFAANAHQSDGVAAVGTCHYPPNGQKDYDYVNPRAVQSSADDWLTYPELTGKKGQVTCETWGGPDYHRNYMRWWFRHLPKAPGVNADGRQNNWWKYVFDFESYDERGRPKAKEAATP
jgi:hypothetical protein